MFKQLTDFTKKTNVQDNNEQLVVFWALRLFNYPPYYSHLKKRKDGDSEEAVLNGKSS